jgi:2-oxoglutarate dehydrogenase E2 component (dihydrolipoamide succinyltransferase)
MGEPLVELETDKVNMEVASTSDGVLRSILKREGETVNIGDTLATVDEDGGASAGSGNGAQAAAPAAEVVPTPEQPRTGAPAAGAPPADVGGNGETARSTPLARRVASEHGVDIARVEGTGPSGRVTKDDVTAFIERTSAPPAPAPAATAPSPAPSAPARRPMPPAAASPAPPAGGDRPEERVRMSRRRQTIARRLVEAQHAAAMLTTFNEVDMTAIMEVRKQRRESFKERYGVGLGFMSFFTRGVIGALKAYPRLNAEIQGDEIVLKRYYDIGIAVGAEEGLVVPVLRDADRMSFAEIEKAVADLARRAREGTLTLAELQGGTFTITNGGVFGSLLSTPILNTPQVGILGMHKIEERPVALNGEVVIRPMMYVALSYDHRIVDGNEAVRFLVHCKQLLEDPLSLLLEG